WDTARCSTPTPRCRPRCWRCARCSVRSRRTARSTRCATGSPRSTSASARSRKITTTRSKRAIAARRERAMKPWDKIIPQHEQEAYRAAGFGRPSGLGKRPCLLIIDVQYRTVGTMPKPFMEAIKEFPTACGQAVWDAVYQIARLLALFRQKGWPVIYPYVSQKETFDKGRLADKVPALMTVAKRGYDFVAETAPEQHDVLLPKKHPSAFFGTPL